MQHDTFQPLGDSPVLTFELRAASEDNIPTRNKAHLEAERTIADKLEDGDVSLNIETGKIGSSTTTIVEGLLSPPSTPPRLRSRSPRDSLRKSPGTMQALDDSYCDRIRSKRCVLYLDFVKSPIPVFLPYICFQEVCHSTSGSSWFSVLSWVMTEMLNLKLVGLTRGKTLLCKYDPSKLCRTLGISRSDIWTSPNKSSALKACDWRHNQQ